MRRPKKDMSGEALDYTADNAFVVENREGSYEMRVDAATGEDRTIFPDAVALIESVAAHQETCSCHAVTFKMFGPIDKMGCCDRSWKDADAVDGSS